MSTEFRFGKRNKILGINAGDGRRIWRLYLMPPNSALEEWLKRYLLHSFYYRKTSYQTNIFCRDTCTFVSIGRVNKFKFRILGPRAAPCWDVASPQSWPRPGFSALPLTVPHARGGALQHIGVPRTSSASSPVWPPPPPPRPGARWPRHHRRAVDLGQGPCGPWQWAQRCLAQRTRVLGAQSWTPTGEGHRVQTGPWPGCRGLVGGTCGSGPWGPLKCGVQGKGLTQPGRRQY